MMAKLLLVSPVFICFAFFAQSSFSLICSNCNLDCSEPVDEPCLPAGSTQKAACLTETFTDINNRTGQQKKCVIFQDDIDVFECVRQPNYTTISCVTCSTDLCNRAPLLPTSSSLSPPSAISSQSNNKNASRGAPGLFHNRTRPYPLTPFDRQDDDNDDENNIQQILEKDKNRVM